MVLLSGVVPTVEEFRFCPVSIGIFSRRRLFSVFSHFNKWASGPPSEPSSLARVLI